MTSVENAIKSREKSPRSTHDVLRPVIILGQCFALLPICGIATKRSEQLKFKWISCRTVYCYLVMIGTATLTVMGIYHNFYEGSSLIVCVDVAFYASSTLASILFIHLAKNWSHLISEWTSLDNEMACDYGFPNVLRRKIIITTVMVMLFAIVEHILSLVSHISDCTNSPTTMLSISEYYKRTFSQMFSYFPFSSLAAFLLQVVHLLSTFTWNYTDLFIMIVSITLSVRFRQVTNALKNCDTEKVADKFWSKIREDYDRVCSLAFTVDSCLSYVVLLSYGTNIFFVLVQLYNSLNTSYCNIEKVYFFYSFGYLIFRTVAVCLFAAQVNDSSKEPGILLRKIPNYTCKDEVRRFLCQVSFDTVALTGCKMFRVTRGLVLQIAGAIVTYELVLIQFQNN